MSLRNWLYDHELREEELDPPPFFKSWRGMYALLLVTLAILIILFYLFTIYFS
jgi:hypothetical protein